MTIEVDTDDESFCMYCTYVLKLTNNQTSSQLETKDDVRLQVAV